MEKEQNTITTELAKNNVTDAVIAKLKADFLPLKIAGIDDKEGYDKVHKARMICRDTRILTEKICKKGREDAVKEQKMWLAKEKEVVSQVSEVETYLKKQEDAIDEAKEAIRIRAERLLKLPGRKTLMEGLEGYLDEYSDEMIMSYDDAQWSEIIAQSQRTKLAKLQKDIDDQKAKERLDRLTERTNILYSVSAVMRSNNGRKEFSKGGVHYSENEIADMSQEEWNRICTEFKNAVIPEARPSENTGISYKPGVTDRIKPISEISDEEKLFNFAGSIERLSRPIMKTETGKNTLSKAEELLSQAINLLRQ